MERFDLKKILKQAPAKQPGPVRKRKGCRAGRPAAFFTFYFVRRSLR